MDQSPVAEEAPAVSNLAICDKCGSEFNKRHIKATMVVNVNNEVL